MTYTPTEDSDWYPVEVPGLMETVGPLLAKRENQQWRYGLRTSERHANAIGSIHGGTITMLADQAMAMVAWDAVDRQPVVTIHIDTRFVAATRPGDFLEVKSFIKHRTSSILFVEASVMTKDRDIAQASGILRVLKTNSGRKHY